MDEVIPEIVDKLLHHDFAIQSFVLATGHYTL
jgi:hypothetical protein